MDVKSTGTSVTVGQKFRLVMLHPEATIQGPVV